MVELIDWMICFELIVVFPVCFFLGQMYCIILDLVNVGGWYKDQFQIKNWIIIALALNNDPFIEKEKIGLEPSKDGPAINWCTAEPRKDEHLVADSLALAYSIVCA